MKRVNQDKLDQQLKEELHRTQQAIPAVVQQRIDDTLSKLLEDTHEHAPAQSIPLPLPIAAPTSTRSTRRANKIWLWTAPAAAILLGAAIISTAYYSPVIDSPVTKGALKQIPGILVSETKSLFKMSNDLGLQIAAEQKVVEQLEDNTVIYDSIRMQVKEILYDGNRLSIGATLQYDEPVTREMLDEIQEELLINGEFTHPGHSKEFKKIDEYTYAIILNYRLPDLANIFEAQIVFMHPAYPDHRWSFTFPVTSTNDKQVYPLSFSAVQQGMEFKARELIVTPYSSALEFIYKQDVKNTETLSLRIQIEDEQGQVLHWVGGGGSIDRTKNGVKEKRIRYAFNPIAKNSTKHLVIKPYIQPVINKRESKKQFIKEFEFTIPLTN
ncbi:DUF4179 domain-containing protein [Paenibacillus assamensis]|uniref:DUF4179 domain-containing protein n=1 Tax=Paenibacillus assamensis TaxID=311244 RepID=UPI0003FD7051|nr:DUF4179 domain-containing protein [Paenibacillus assamensis]